MWFFQNKRKGASTTCTRRLTFDQLEDRNLLSITYPVDPGVVSVDGGTLTADYIPVDNLSIGSDATVNLTPLSGNPVEDLSVKNAVNNGSLNITGGDKTLGNISGTGNTTLSNGATLTVTSLSQNILTLAPGSTLTIAALPGGPSSTPQSTSPTPTHAESPAPADLSAVMDGGTVTYCSDALPNLSAINNATLACTDPADVSDAWRSTKTVPGADAIQFPILGYDGTVVPQSADPSTWPDHSTTDTESQTPLQSTVYQNRFGQTIAVEQNYADKEWDGTESNETNLLAYDATQNIYYGEGQVASIVPQANELVVTLASESASVQNVAGSTKSGDAQGGSVNIVSNDITGPVNYTINISVAAGHTFFDSILSPFVSHPSGDWTQPDGWGEGSYGFSLPDPNEGFCDVMMYGTNKYTCNTLTSISQNYQYNSGTMQVWVSGLDPKAIYYIDFDVIINSYVTALDPRLANPNGRAPGGGTDVNIQTYFGTPIPPDFIFNTAKCAARQSDPGWIGFICQFRVERTGIT